MQYREDAINDLQTWRRDVLRTVDNAAILSGEYGGPARRLHSRRLLRATNQRPHSRAPAGDMNFRTDDQGEQLLSAIRSQKGPLKGWAEPDVPDYYTCRFSTESKMNALLRNQAELKIAYKYGDPRNRHDASLITRRERERRPDAGELTVDAGTEVTANLWRCRGISKDHAWKRPDNNIESPDKSTARVKQTRVYTSRYEACGFDEKSREKPWSYCDRVITRANDPVNGNKACPFTFEVGIRGDGARGDGSYATYTSVPLCKTSE